MMRCYIVFFCFVWLFVFLVEDGIGDVWLCSVVGYEYDIRYIKLSAYEIVNYVGVPNIVIWDMFSAIIN